LLVPTGDPPSVAAAVPRLLSDEELGSRIEEGAIRRGDVFSERRTAERFAQLPTEVAA
jgi:glycosyltransferase involved in cell wall biosynthesis